MMKTTTTLLLQLFTIAIATTATAAASAVQYGSTVRHGLPATLPRRLNGRAGTGPVGFLTVDDTVYGSPDGGVKLASLSSAGGSEVMSSDEFDGAYTSCLPVFTGATVPDCRAVLGDIRANNGTISVAGGLCLNWWEGTCLARVCAREEGTVYAQDARWVAGALEETALGVCVAKGESAVVADCADHADPCGTYRFWLQSHP